MRSSSPASSAETLRARRESSEGEGGPRWASEALSWNRCPGASGRRQFDLTLRIGEGEGLVASPLFNSDLFYAITARRNLGLFATIPAAVVAEARATHLGDSAAHCGRAQAAADRGERSRGGAAVRSVPSPAFRAPGGADAQGRGPHRPAPGARPTPSCGQTGWPGISGVSVWGRRSAPVCSSCDPRRWPRLTCNPQGQRFLRAARSSLFRGEASLARRGLWHRGPTQPRTPARSGAAGGRAGAVAGRGRGGDRVRTGGGSRAAHGPGNLIYLIYTRARRAGQGGRH
jgi:hypothetical protein